MQASGLKMYQRWSSSSSEEQVTVEPAVPRLHGQLSWKRRGPSEPFPRIKLQLSAEVP